MTRTMGMHLTSIPQIPRLAARALRPLGLLTLLALMLAFGTYVYLLVPAEEHLVTLRASYEKARQRQITLWRERKTQEEGRQIQRDLGAIWERLPSQRDFAGMAIAISELARKVRVSVPGMTYNHEKAQQGLPTKASLSFQATGKYRDIYRFIHRLETTEPYLVIEQLNASRAQDSGQGVTHHVRFNMRVVTFLKPNPFATEAS